MRIQYRSGNPDYNAITVIERIYMLRELKRLIRQQEKESMYQSKQIIEPRIKYDKKRLRDLFIKELFRLNFKTKDISWIFKITTRQANNIKNEISSKEKP